MCRSKIIDYSSYSVLFYCLIVNTLYSKATKSWIPRTWKKKVFIVPSLRSHYTECIVLKSASLSDACMTLASLWTGLYLQWFFKNYCFTLLNVIYLHLSIVFGSTLDWIVSYSNMLHWILWKMPPYFVEVLLAVLVGTCAVSVASVSWYLIKLQHVPTFHSVEMGFLITRC